MWFIGDTLTELNKPTFLRCFAHFYQVQEHAEAPIVFTQPNVRTVYLLLRRALVQTWP